VLHQYVGIAEGIFGIFCAAAGIPAGWLADRMRRDRTLRLCGFVMLGARHRESYLGSSSAPNPLDSDQEHKVMNRSSIGAASRLLHRAVRCCCSRHCSHISSAVPAAARGDVAGPAAGRSVHCAAGRHGALLSNTARLLPIKETCRIFRCLTDFPLLQVLWGVAEG
jgi:hypothetical protein